MTVSEHFSFPFDSPMNLLESAARIVGVSCPSFTIGESQHCSLTRQELRRFCVVQPWRPVPMVLELRCVENIESLNDVHLKRLVASQAVFPK